MGRDYREESKKHYQSTAEAAFTCGQLRTGALLRIADATEAIAKDYVKLQEDAEFYKRQRDSFQRGNERVFRQISAYKGVITKMKRRQA